MKARQAMLLMFLLGMIKMASNTRPKFKHPIQTSTNYTGENISVISPEELCSSVTPDDRVVQIRWNGLSVLIRKLIGIDEMADMYCSILQHCSDNGYIHQEYIDLEFRHAVISYYSNISLPTNSEDICSIVYGTDLYSTICKYINTDQVSAIECALKRHVMK